MRRLNDLVKKSDIFKKLYIKKLPRRIVRKHEHEKASHFFKKKKAHDEESVDENEISEDEEEKEQIMNPRRADFFLEVPVDGEYHISQARTASHRRHKDRVEWSGQDVMVRFDPYKARLAVNRLDSIRVWPYKLHGFIKKRRVLLKSFMRSSLVENSMTACVLGNTVVMTLDYYGNSIALQNFCEQANTYFTIIFTVELGLRLIAIGPAKWAADKMNYMDGTVVTLSLVELIFLSGNGALGSLKSLRIFRVFRILRVARLLRGLKSMIQIINVLQRSFTSFMYLGMLILLFIFIYALLGMQLFGGKIRDPGAVGTVRYNFDSFNIAFITSFILLTTENWNQVMFYCYDGPNNEFVIALYFVSCIFIGNWMLLNLFLAILLDSFTAVEEEDLITPEKLEAIKQKMLEDLRFKEGEDFIEGLDEIQKEGFVLKAEHKGKKKKEEEGPG